jgi:hypothetical protein
VQRLLQVGAVAISLVTTSWCPRAESGGIAADSGSAEFDEPFRSANYCATPYDCFDLGPVCPVDCHVPVNSKATAWLELIDLAAQSRLSMAEGRCQLSCNQPFYGFECVAGRCQARRAKPTYDICWGSDGGRQDCIEMLERTGNLGECREFCDGKVPRRPEMLTSGRRFQVPVRIELGNGHHVTQAALIDFVACSTCRDAGLLPQSERHEKEP